MKTDFRSSLALFSRPIAFHRIFVTWCGSVKAALMFSQLVYWTSKSEAGWIFKTIKEWEEETGLSRREQLQARRQLKKHGLLEERKAGVPARLYYRIIPKAFKSKLKSQLDGNGMPSWTETGQLDERKRASRLDRNGPYNKETTKENTKETPAARGCAPSFLEEPYDLGRSTKLSSTIEKWAKFSIKRKFHLRDGFKEPTPVKGAHKESWSRQTLAAWQNLYEKMDTKEVDALMDWYLLHYDEEFIPKVRTFKMFCEKFTQISDSRGRTRNGARRYKESEDVPADETEDERIYRQLQQSGYYDTEDEKAYRRARERGLRV